MRCNMKFSEFLEHRDVDLYNEVDWKNLIQKGALAGALAGSALGIGSKALSQSPVDGKKTPVASKKISSYSIATIDHEKDEKGNEAWQLKVSGVKSYTEALKVAKEEAMHDYKQKFLTTTSSGGKTQVVGKNIDMSGFEVFGGTFDKRTDVPNKDGSFIITVIKHNAKNIDF